MGIFDFVFGPNVEKMKAKKDVKGLWNVVKKNDPKTRTAAKFALVEIGQPAAATLIQVLKEENKEFSDGTSWHSKAARILHLIGEPAVDCLFQLLNDENEHVQRVAKEILAEIDSPKTKKIRRKHKAERRRRMREFEKSRNQEIEALIEDLWSNFPSEQARAHRGLKGMGESAAEHLITYLQCLRKELIDKGYDKFVNYQITIVVNILLEMGEAAVNPLLKALKDKDRIKRLVAAEVLGDVLAVETVDGVTRFVRGRRPGEVLSGTIEHTVTILTLRAATRALREALADEDEGVRIAAEKALGMFME